MNQTVILMKRKDYLQNPVKHIKINALRPKRKPLVDTLWSCGDWNPVVSSLPLRPRRA